MTEDLDQTQDPNPTRMIVMGQAALTDTFALLGFETFPDATPPDVDALMAELLAHDEPSALVFLEQALAGHDCPALDKCRAQCNRVVIVEIPPLHAPEDYRPRVESLVKSLLGANVLEAW